MNILKLSAFLLLFYFLVLIQASFLSHFYIFKYFSNFAFLAVLAMIFLDKDKKIFSKKLLIALFFSFILDIYSSGFFGFYIIITFLLSVIFKKFFNNYVRIDFAQKS